MRWNSKPFKHPIHLDFTIGGAICRGLRPPHLTDWRITSDRRTVSVYHLFGARTEMTQEQYECIVAELRILGRL